MAAGAVTTSWWADGTTWAIVGVAVAVVSAGITVWAQFASARVITKSGVVDRDDVTLGRPVPGLDIAGDWTADWQSFKDGEEVHRTQPVRIERAAGDNYSITALDRGAEIADGGFLWAGEVRLWDNAIVMGWYAATDSSVRSKGTLYYAIHPQGQSMMGRWVGLSHDGLVVHGEARLSRTMNSP